MRFAFDAKGEYGAWVRDAPPWRDQRRCVSARRHQRDGRVARLRRHQRCRSQGPRIVARAAEQVPTLFAAGETGPLWYRDSPTSPKRSLSPTLDGILERMKARAIVIGHTTVLPGKITTRLGGRVMQIDTGMVNGEFYPGGVPSALEMQGTTLTAIYLDRREPLAPCLRLGRHRPRRSTRS